MAANQNLFQFIINQGRSANIMARKRVLPTVLSLMIFVTSGFANSRAPYTRTYRGTEELHTTIPGITVMREDLLFDADAPFKPSQKNECNVRVKAVYTISSIESRLATFDFISTEPVIVNSIINNTIVEATKSVLVEKLQGRGHKDNINKYSTSFSGWLREGTNTISVSYVHPLSYEETRRSVFIFYSKTNTFFSYYLFPLKEWNLSPTFMLNIVIRFKDDTGWTKAVFGSNYAMEIEGLTYDISGPKRNIRKRLLVQSTKNKKTDREIFESSFSFGPVFPDELTVYMKH